MGKNNNKNYILIIVIVIAIILILYGIYEYNVNFFNYSYKYEKNIYTEKEFDNILLLCNTINTEDMVLDPKANNRLMYEFKPENNKTEVLKSLLFNENFIEKIRKLTGNYNLIPCLEVPVEYRKYPKGSYMDWHYDTQILENQLQYECVITLTNTSDSLTLMNQVFFTDKISSEPNSLVIVRAHGVKHMVTEITKGERTILKFVFKEKELF